MQRLILIIRLINGRPLGCGNYTQPLRNFKPEVEERTDNPDGTVTLTINAVCEEAGNDAAITHK